MKPAASTSHSAVVSRLPGNASRKYSLNGQIASEAYYDAGGNLVSPRQDVACRTCYKYDERGNLIRSDYYDEQNRLSCKFGCATKIREYDEINARLRDDIRIVTLKGEGKFTPEAAGNAEKIIIHPFLLTIGHHANHDIKEELIPAVKGTGAHVVYQNESILSLYDEFALIFEEHFMALLEKLDLLRTIGSK